MPGKTPFRLNRSGLLLALISTAFAGQAQAAAGRVEFAIGPATVVGADGRTRAAARGTEVDAGDTVRTQQNGRVQVRMADGAYISLQPNTEFGIKDYKFEGKTDGSENAFYSLLKGAMRTVTGLIGRVNRNKYLVSTPTATVGIRGTGGVIQVQDDGSTLVQGTSGVWFLANPSGTIDIPAGVSGVAPSDPNQPPQETTDVPTSGPAPLPPQQDFAQGNQRENDGDPVLVSPIVPLQSGDGYGAIFAFSQSSQGLLIPRVLQEFGSATFNGSGQLTHFSAFSESGYSIDAGVHADFGTDGILAWGRWVGDVTADNLVEKYGPSQGIHYVVGTPTPSMPTSGSGTYTLVGATKPTYMDGSNLPGTFTGTLSVDFAIQLLTANFTVAMPDRTYQLSGDTRSLSTSNFSLSASSITGCAASCSAFIQGFFAGPSAERAGVGYHITDSDFETFTKDVLGTAAFAKQ
jgi:hypothetical protein